MPDLFDLSARWWKQILSLMVITLIVTTIIVWLIPKKYLGVATALPASTYTQDKTGVFSQNLQSLYSSLGSPDDLDMIVGTAHLDTVYRFLAEQFQLVGHYNISGMDRKFVVRAAHMLKERTRVIKSDYGELKVKVWDTDRDWAARLANAIMEKLQQIHQDVQTTNNAMMLSKVSSEYNEKKKEYQKISDSLQHINPATNDFLSMQKSSLVQQMMEYEKLLDQYKLMVSARPQALIIIEKATPALKPDKPRSFEIVIAAAVVSLFFGILVALVLERRRTITK